MREIRVRIAWALALFAAFLCLLFSLAETTLEIRGARAFIKEDGQLRLCAYANGKAVSAAWTSGDPGALSVSRDGLLTAHPVQAARRVEIACAWNGASASVFVTVAPNAQSIRMQYGGAQCAAETVLADIAAGDARLQLELAVLPPAACAGIQWTSSNEDVATVDENGLVCVRARGIATITATALNGRYTTCKVRGDYAAASVQISAPDQIPVGASAQAEASILPEIARGGKLTWKSSDESILRVSANGAVSARLPGIAVITCAAESGAFDAREIEAYVPVKEIRAPEKTFALAVGETRALNAAAFPANCKYAGLTYATSAPGIALVDSNGNATGVREGEAVITVSGHEGKALDICVQVAYVSLSRIQFSADRAQLRPGETLATAVSLFPENASSRAVVYESDRPDVATVDGNGVVTAVAAGRALISVRPAEGAQALDALPVRVVDERTRPLDGVVVGLNPGHQISIDYKQMPMSPGSCETGNANNSGARGVKTGNMEYRLNLEIALYLRDCLEEMGAQVVMTRTTSDVNLNNVERALMLNDAHVDVALQIHCDYIATDHARSGAAAFVRRREGESYEIAADVLKHICLQTQARNRGVCLYAKFMSLNWSETPSILLECGFLSNPDEDVKLGTPEYQMQIARGIADGLAAYFAVNEEGA